MPNKHRAPAAGPGLRPGAAGASGYAYYSTERQPRQDPFGDLLIQALAHVVEAGAEAEWADQSGDREGCLRALERKGRHWRIALALMEAHDGRFA